MENQDSQLRDAIQGQDIVYVNLAGDLETMTGLIVKAMEEIHVKRIIAISSIGIYETPLKSILRPYRKLADIIEASDLDYTILRPTWFTHVNEIDYELTKKGESEKGTVLLHKWKPIAEEAARFEVENKTIEELSMENGFFNTTLHAQFSSISYQFLVNVPSKLPASERASRR